MTAKISITASLAFAALFSACGGEAPNANTNVNINANTAIIVDPNNLPPGLSASPIAPSAETTPGIPPPGEVNKVPRGATPTPGIPDPKELSKPFKPGATPTPGIPDAETLRRQMRMPANSVNAPSNPAGSDTMMMRSRRRPTANGNANVRPQ